MHLLVTGLHSVSNAQDLAVKSISARLELRCYAEICELSSVIFVRNHRGCLGDIGKDC